MVSIVTNPSTSSLYLSIQSKPTTPSTCNFQKPNTFLPSSSFNNITSLSHLRNQRTPWFSHFTSIPRTSITCGVTLIDQSQFPDTVLESDVPVLVEFVADWCGPCRLIAPAIEWASQEYKERLKIVKLDHDLNPQLIEEYKVYGLPSLILFKNGKEVPDSRREGAMTKEKLRKYLDGFLEPISAA